MGATVRSSTRVIGFKDAELDFQLIRQLGSATYGGASIGEIFYLVSNLQNETAENLVKSYELLANEQLQDAKNRASKSHFISAKEQFLKACNSFRAAEYFTKVNLQEHAELGIKSRECFLEYLKLSNFYSKVDFLDYKDLKLPYYLIAPDKSMQKRKTVIIVSGFDGTLEESFIQSGLGALTRDYNVVCFAGPGQMDTLRFNPNTYFEPDFEKPISALLDNLEQNTIVDKTNISLIGISFGGYFCTRATCFEKRIKSVVANSPIVDLKKYVLGFSDASDMSDDEDFSYNDIPFIPDDVFPLSLKEMTGNLLIRFGNRSMKQTIKYLDEFNIEQNLKNIKCNVLALIGEGEGEEPTRQCDYFYKSVECNKNFYKFSTKDGADTHCQVGNLNFANCIIYDWLDEL